jgi:transcriptional regulator with XRE-family HTH domain
MTVVRTCEDCGHVGRYKSRGLAEYHFPRHSCALVQERRDRAERRLRKLTGEGVKCDCRHPYARHQHGTRDAYCLDKCRCHPCKVANRHSEQDRRRERAYGRPGALVDAEPARRHVRGLMAGGMGLKQIAAVSGVARGRLTDLLYGRGSADPREVRPPRKRIHRDLAASLLAVQLTLAPGAHIPNVGTQRRIQALVAVGWSMTRIAAELGMGRSNFGPVAHGARNVTVATAQAVAALYDRRWDQAPPTSTTADLTAYRRARRYAADHGWVPPLAWDDGALDDPDARPADLRDHRRVNHTRVDPEDVEFLLETAATRAEIAQRLHVQPGTLEQQLKRLGRRDVWQRLLQAEQRRRTAPGKVA